MIPFKMFDSPDGFFQAIPKKLNENLEFRKLLHGTLEKDTSLQDVFLQLCSLNFKIAFNTFLWTSNPRLEIGKRLLPFILRPKQEEVSDVLHDALLKQYDVGINKSRDEGATELCTKTFALSSILEPNGYFVVGSRNKDLVDSFGDKYTLFAKIDQVFDTMPIWFRNRLGELDRKDMQIVIKGTGTVIRGETTNESFSAGRRATAILLDEFGRVEPRIAESIEGSVHDVTGCVVYLSTHWFGQNHPFNKALRKESTKVVNLLWYDNPVKSAGLYKSPTAGTVEIVDKKYYVDNYSDLFGQFGYLLESSFTIEQLQKAASTASARLGVLSETLGLDVPEFVADGCENLPKGADLRSPWHDGEEKKRAGNFRDFIANVWGSPIGSQDSVFNPITLSRIEAQNLTPASFIGDISFDNDVEGTPVGVKVRSGGKGRLRWWVPTGDTGSYEPKQPNFGSRYSDMPGGLPDLTHNYVIGCDPALGTGTSNSVAAVYDCNTHEIVGLWVDPNTPYELFADTVMALGKWLGDAYVIFENNGGHGVNFGRRLVKRGYYRVHTQRKEDKKLKKVENKLGWTSNPNTKADLLGELGIALSEGLKSEPKYISCVIHDADILNELRGYIFYENGDIGSSECADLTSGAKKRHGDRVIAVALAVLGSKYQMKKPKKEQHELIYDSFEYRQTQDEEESAKNKKSWHSR